MALLSVEEDYGRENRAPRAGSQKTPLGLGVNRPPGSDKAGHTTACPGGAQPSDGPRRLAARSRTGEDLKQGPNLRHHLLWPCSPRALLHTATEAAGRQDAGKPTGGFLRARICPWYGKVSHLSPARVFGRTGGVVSLGNRHRPLTRCR